MMRNKIKLVAISISFFMIFILLLKIALDIFFVNESSDLKDLATMLITAIISIMLMYLYDKSQSNATYKNVDSN